MPPRGTRRDSKATAAAANAATPAAAADAAATPAAAVAVKPEPPAGTSDSDSSQPDEDDATTNDAPMQTAAEATAALRMPAASPSLMQSASLILPTSSVLQQHKQAGVGNLGPVTAPTGIARFSTMGPHGASNTLSASGVAPLPNVGGFVAGGALSSMQGGGPIGGGGAGFSRQVSRLPSVGLNGTVQSGDWRALVSVEERITIRRRLREAYLRHCTSYNDLLDTATAVDEELLFACSSNRIDFFKSSIDWDTRIQIKCQQLKNPHAATGAGAAAASSPPPASNGMGAKKRSMEDASGGNLSASSTSLLASSLFGNADLTAIPAAAASSSTLQLPPVSQLRAGAAFPAASVPVDLANLLAAGDAAQQAKKQRT